MYMVMAGSLFVIIFIGVFFKLYNDGLMEKKANLFYDFASSLQKEFIMASESKIGYERNFTLPEKLDDFEYEVKLYEKTMILNYTDNIIVLPIPKVVGELKKGTNVLVNNGSLILK